MDDNVRGHIGRKKALRTSKAETYIEKQLFETGESRNNIAGLYDLLLQIDRRKNPHLYTKEKRVEAHD